MLTIFNQKIKYVDFLQVAIFSTGIVPRLPEMWFQDDPTVWCVCLWDNSLGNVCPWSESCGNKKVKKFIIPWGSNSNMINSYSSILGWMFKKNNNSTIVTVNFNCLSAHHFWTDGASWYYIQSYALFILLELIRFKYDYCTASCVAVVRQNLSPDCMKFLLLKE